MQPILEVEHLKKYYPLRHSFLSSQCDAVRACDDVSFKLYPGETLGVVGESGCGKSTTMKAVIRLIEPTAGSVILQGTDFLSLRGNELKQARRHIKMIFQDPYSSLNPRMTVKEIISEPLDITKGYADREEREEIIVHTMQQVGLDPEFTNRYPHEFSGGQRQRIGIARAIILHPEVIICDEPVSALDVSIQAKILNLLKKLQRELGIAYIFISHNLGVVRNIADRVIVMYLGQIVEEGNNTELFQDPQHPYTQVLLSSVPGLSGGGPVIMQGDVPDPADPPSGCRFHTRCPYAAPICRLQKPELLENVPGHRCACHRTAEISLSGKAETEE